MNFNDIISLSKSLKNQCIRSMSFENGHMASEDMIRRDYLSSDILSKLEMGEDKVDISDKDKEYFTNNIPTDFSSYIHVSGNFYNIDYNNKVIYKVPYDDIPDKDNIFDLSGRASNNIYETIIFISDVLDKSIKDYYNLHRYNPKNYTITERVEMPSSAYDHSFSITKEESDKISKWEDKHYRKYHKNETSRAAIAVSNFEIQFRATSIGVYCDCVCKDCLEKSKQAKYAGDTGLAKKLKKDAIFEVRELE